MATPEAMKLNGKTVGLWPVYQPSLDRDEEMVGRTDELRMALAAWIRQPGFAPLSPLLVGEAGVGKNRLVYELARCTGKELFVFQGHEGVMPEDLGCAVRVSDDPQRKMDYILSPLAMAMTRGGICFVDEIGKLHHRALAPLASVLDERRYLDSVVLGERIVAHPGFRFIAATNTADLAGQPLPDFVGSRLRPVIHVGLPSREEIDRIVRIRFPRFDRSWRETNRFFREFWQLWRAQRGDIPPSPRDALFLFGLAASLFDAEGAAPEKMLENLEAKSGLPTRGHLEAAFRQLFSEGNDPWQRTVSLD